MIISITPNENYRTINFFAENIDDGIKIGLMKTKMDNHKISYSLVMDEEKIKGIRLKDADLIRMMLGVS